MRNIKRKLCKFKLYVAERVSDAQDPNAPYQFAEEDNCRLYSSANYLCGNRVPKDHDPRFMSMQLMLQNETCDCRCIFTYMLLV